MDYYVIERENDDRYPLLAWDDERGVKVARGEPVPDTTTPVRLRLGAPIPAHPVMVDFHVLPEPVVSAKIASVLRELALPEVQLVPAYIRVKGTAHERWILNVMRRIQALDLAQSTYQRDASGDLSMLERIVLDAAALETLPVEERLVFRPKEYGALWLLERSVKEAIEATQPVGLRFFHVRDWDDTVAFR